ncbi:Hypothetical predicted protein [Mytilus galloprovincialis]|uniref:Uncharacterized protein n=2 Tax=Mytilus galloprovincialis TaxID=29158 RepID=A0A8B6CD14_MYTGA|nr:Hypothetical predicted protein [Mytilus galloprovincialis]
MNIHNTDNEASNEYRVKTLRVFGGIQIGIGVLCGILSLAGVITDSVNLSKNCDYNDNSNYNYDDYYYRCDWYYYASPLLAFDIVCVIFSGWFILTGTFPFCMTPRRQSRWKCLKIAFMVCCIVGAAIFVPTVFSLGVVGAIFRAEYKSGAAVLSSIIALLGFVELVIAIVASSFCCCCSSFGSSERTFVYITGGPQTNVLGMPNTQIIQTVPGQNVSAAHTGVYPAGMMTQQYPVSTPQFTAAAPGQGVNNQSPPPYKI